MGCNNSNVEVTQIELDKEKEIVRKMNEQRIKNAQQRKILLLGAGSAGKSTVFKQLQKSYGTGFDQNEILETAVNIQQNLITGILQLLKQSQTLYDRDQVHNQDCYVPLDNESVVNDIQIVVTLKDTMLGEDGDENELTNLGEAIANLWDLKSIQATYSRRLGLFSFPENMDFFFNKSKTVMKRNYMPNDEDMLLARSRTSGVLSKKYKFDNHVFQIFDVGGQRNERKKWIHAFENVSCVIFVGALNHYNTVLFEDESKNSMHESLQLFNEVLNSKWFKNTGIILFLNKTDLFHKELSKGIMLDVCFSRNAYGVWNGPKYYEESNITPYDPIKDEQNNKKLSKCYNESLKFIEDIYRLKNKTRTRNIFTHKTCATNQDNIKQVFEQVKQTVVNLRLE